MNKLVSVIMGVYNSNEEYLISAIDSILAQTYKNLELIICNDCSTNESINQILLSYEKKDCRVKIIQNKTNSGLAYTLNHCLENVKGEYIGRMDDDDISHTDRIEKEVKFLNDNPDYGLVGCNVNIFSNDGVWGHSHNSENVRKEDLLYGAPFLHPTILVRREAYERVNGYRVEKITKRTEDYDLFMRMYANGIIGYNLQEILFDYRMDLNGYKKQKFRYRIDEAVIKYHGFKQLGLLPIGYVYIIKPIISGLIPAKVKMLINRKRFK